jgi:hypothetical protein
VKDLTKRIEIVRVFAARRGLVVAAMTERRERMASITSRFANGQF